LSGGLDSSANLALCHALDKPILALTVDYGQRAAKKEIQAAKKLCSHYKVKHEVLDLPWLGDLGGSALTDSKKSMPHLEPYQLDQAELTQETARSVWVPNRNGVLISAAAAYAESLDAQQVVVGFNREEAATFPDNSTEFLRRSSEALVLSTATAVRVFCYTDQLDKREIVAKLRETDPEFPFDLVWSCYEGKEKPCGQCESCRRFKRATE
jgi:7-cyano-7-deazaguanine synthase